MERKSQDGHQPPAERMGMEVDPCLQFPCQFLHVELHLLIYGALVPFNSPCSS
jgi:hypothetical protein